MLTRKQFSSSSVTWGAGVNQVIRSISRLPRRCAGRVWRWLKVVPRIEIDDGKLVRQVSIDELLRAKQPGTATVVTTTAVSIEPHPLSTVCRVAEESAYYVRQTFDAHPLVIDRLQGQYWFPEYGYLVNPDGKVWHHATLGTYADEKFETILGVLRTSRAFPLVREKSLEKHLRNVREVRGLRIVTSHYASHNFGHFTRYGSAD